MFTIRSYNGIRTTHFTTTYQLILSTLTRQEEAKNAKYFYLAVCIFWAHKKFPLTQICAFSQRAKFHMMSLINKLSSFRLRLNKNLIYNHIYNPVNHLCQPIFMARYGKLSHAWLTYENITSLWSWRLHFMETPCIFIIPKLSDHKKRSSSLLIF